MKSRVMSKGEKRGERAERSVWKRGEDGEWDLGLRWVWHKMTTGAYRRRKVGRSLDPANRQHDRKVSSVYRAILGGRSDESKT